MLLFFQAVFSEPQSFLSLFRKCFCITLLFMFVYCNFHSHIVLTRNFLTQFLIIFNKVYYAIVISVPIFIVGIYTVLPFLPVFVYKDTAMLLVLAFFYRAITVKVPNFDGIYSREFLHGQASQGSKGK